MNNEENPQVIKEAHSTNQGNLDLGGEIDFPKNYYLVSVTMRVNGKREFADIPMFSHRMVFPNRVTIYGFACDRFGLNAEDTENFKSFAVLGIYKFENVEDYESYVSLPTEGEPAEDSAQPEDDDE